MNLNQLIVAQLQLEQSHHHCQYLFFCVVFYVPITLWLCTVMRFYLFFCFLETSIFSSFSISVYIPSRPFPQFQQSLSSNVQTSESHYSEAIILVRLLICSKVLVKPQQEMHRGQNNGCRHLGSVQLLFFFLKSTSGYRIGCGVGFQQGLQLRCTYGINLTQKHEFIGKMAPFQMPWFQEYDTIFTLKEEKFSFSGLCHSFLSFTTREWFFSQCLQTSLQLLCKLQPATVYCRELKQS